MTTSAKLLRLVLGLVGLAFVFIGLNTGIGGIATLGWQFPSGFFTITEPDTFARHDSNARFFAGVFTALGLVTAASALWFNQLRPIVIAFLLAIALGGLFRLIQPGYSPITDTALLPSLLAEIILGPLLALWMTRST